MSRIGKEPVKLADGVTATIAGQKVTVKGKLGEPYADKYGVEFVAGEKCWGVKDVDVYMPAATQNDVRMESAEKIAASGVKYYIEVANMPTTNDALNL